MKNFIIKDWAGNILDYKGLFELPVFAVAMEFDCFDAAEDYLCNTMSEEEYDDMREELYIVEGN